MIVLAGGCVGGWGVGWQTATLPCKAPIPTAAVDMMNNNEEGMCSRSMSQQ